MKLFSKTTTRRSLLEQALQEGVDYDESDKIYVILSGGDFFIDNMIKWVTNSPYSHIALGMNINTPDVHFYGMNLEKNTLNQEPLSVYSDDDYTVSVWSYTIDPRDKKRLQERLDDLVTSGHIKYSYVALISHIARKILKIPGIFKKSAVEYESLVCSEFVFAILREFGIKMPLLPKVPAPADFLSMPGKKFLFRGKSNNFARLVGNYITRLR